MYRQKGNVLFLILIAVALFAALSYAVTQSSRSGGNDISDEDARLAASQIIQYATLIEQTVTRLRLSNGCRDTQISFAADSDGDGNWYDTDDDYHNPNAPSDFRCHVFHAGGGKIAIQSPPDNANDGAPYYYSGRMSFTGQSPSFVSNTASAIDLIMVLPNMTSKLCAAINESLLGLSQPIDLLHLDGPTNQKFVGTYSWGHNMHNHGQDDFVALCATNSVSQSGDAGMNGLHMIYILISR